MVMVLDIKQNKLCIQCETSCGLQWLTNLYVFRLPTSYWLKTIHIVSYWWPLTATVNTKDTRFEQQQQQQDLVLKTDWQAFCVIDRDWSVRHIRAQQKKRILWKTTQHQWQCKNKISCSLAWLNIQESSIVKMCCWFQENGSFDFPLALFGGM